MKASDFSSVVRALADALGRLGAHPARDELVALSTLFDATPSATVAAVLKRAGEIDATANANPPTLRALADILEAARPIFETIAKPAVERDVQLVARFLASRPSLSLSELVRSMSAPRTSSSRAGAKKAPSSVGDLTGRYLPLLRETRGDETRFAAVFSQLSADANAGRAEILALAKAFTGLPGKSKQDGLKRIWNSHQDILTVRAKAAATAGRSAA